jgi:purine-nucleoside phosphorylase
MVKDFVLDWKDNLDFGIILEQNWMFEEACEKLPRGQRFYCFSIDRDVYTIDLKNRRYGLLQSNGSSSTACYVEELVKRGAKNIYRIGTCGSLQKDIELGDIVLSKSSIRDEGTTFQYVDKDFPAESDPVRLEELSKYLSNKKDLKLHTGMTWTTDGRFVESNEKILRFSGMGIKSVDMETSAVLVVCSVRKVPGFSISIVTDSPIEDLNKSFKGYIKDLEYVKKISEKKFMDILKGVIDFSSNVK